MKKNKMRHYETLKRGLFPQVFPTFKWMGKQKKCRAADGLQHRSPLNTDDSCVDN